MSRQEVRLTEKPFPDDVSVNVLCRMKENGFDFARTHPIDFFAISPSEREARQAAGQFRGESLRAQVVVRDDGSWNLQVSKVMYVTYVVIGASEHDLEKVVVPLGGVPDGWGVTQEATSLRP